MVHGLSGWGFYYNTSGKQFVRLGYRIGDVYEVTYGGGKGKPFNNKRLKCEYVKKVCVQLHKLVSATDLHIFFFELKYSHNSINTSFYSEKLYK